MTVMFLKWFEELTENARKRTVSDSFKMEKWISNHRTFENRWFRLQKGNFYFLQIRMCRFRKETNQLSNFKYRLEVFRSLQKKKPPPPITVGQIKK